MNQQLGFLSSACGDCHLANFGAFAAPEQNILFDINDFDETLPGVDITADLKRLGASVAVAALATTFQKKRARATAATTVEAYRTHLRSLARRSPLEIWHSRVEFAHEIKRIEHRGLRSELQGILFKARDTLVQDDNFRHLVKSSNGRLFYSGRLPEHRDSRPRLSLPQACRSRLHLATSAGPVLQGLASRAR